METRNLGRSGLRVSLVGLGCNNFGARIDDEAAKAVIHHALDLGITLFDTADVYGNRGGSEEIIGKTLGPRRREVVLATKFGLAMNDAGTAQGGSRRYVAFAVEESLRRLRTDWIDLYMLHVPDPLTPIEETMRALDDLVRSGKVRYVGCSGFAAWQLVDAGWTAREVGAGGFVCGMQQYNLLSRQPEAELLPAMRAMGVGLLPFWPLASGLLTGKYRPGEALPEGARLTTTQDKRFLNESNMVKVERLNRVAAERGHSLLEMAFGWLAANDVVGSIIAGATRPEQLDANVAAAGCKLSAEDMAAVDAATR